MDQDLKIKWRNTALITISPVAYTFPLDLFLRFLLVELSLTGLTSTVSTITCTHLPRRTLITVGAGSGVSGMRDSSSFRCFLPSGPSPLGSGSGTEVGSDKGLVGESLASSQFLKLVLSLGGELTSFKVALLLKSFLGGRFGGNSCGDDGVALLPLSVGGTTESTGSVTVIVETGCEAGVL